MLQSQRQFWTRKFFERRSSFAAGQAISRYSLSNKEDIDRGISLAALRETLASEFKLTEQDFLGSYCLHPSFLKRQVEVSRRNLGLETIDLMYLHNPETWKAKLKPAAFQNKMEVIKM